MDFFMAEILLFEALREGLQEEMDRDPKVFVMGEDVGHYGGSYKVTKGFAEKYGDLRLLDTPIAENLFIDHDSSSVPHSSSVVQPTQHSIAIDRPRRQINPPKRLIEECNIVTYTLSCAEEV